jgi:hypothetical protein
MNKEERVLKKRKEFFLERKLGSAILYVTNPNNNETCITAQRIKGIYPIINKNKSHDQLCFSYLIKYKLTFIAL